MDIQFSVLSEGDIAMPEWQDIFYSNLPENQEFVSAEVVYSDDSVVLISRFSKVFKRGNYWEL